MSGTLKILALASIIVGGGYIGILISSGFDIRVKQIEQLRLAIEQMGFSIGFLKMPVSEALQGAGKARRGAVGRVLLSAAEKILKDSSSYDAFDRAFRENKSSLCLKREDMDILTDFAQKLGTGDVENELSNISAAVARLKVAQAEAEGERDKKSGMWRGFGFLGGILVVILLF